MGEDATIDDISFEYKGYRIPYGYYKFLGDFGMFTPDGKAAPQKTLSLESYDFEEAKKFFSDAESLRRNEILQQFANGTVRDGFRLTRMWHTSDSVPSPSPDVRRLSAFLFSLRPLLVP